MYGWIAVIVCDRQVERHQEEMFSFSGKFSDLLNSFSLTSIVILSFGFVFWDTFFFAIDDLLVPIEF